MFNHRRGLWGYTGRAPDGQPLTVQSTGMGGPSAAIVCEELVALGARRLLRVGTCGALVDELRLGDLLAADAVIAADGASAALGGDSVISPDPALTAGLVAAGARPATVVSTDLFFDPRPAAELGWSERGAQAVDMESAAILRVAANRGVAAGSLLAVTDASLPRSARGAPSEPSRMEDAALDALGPRLGEIGYEALRNR